MRSILSVLLTMMLFFLSQGCQRKGDLSKLSVGDPVPEVVLRQFNGQAKPLSDYHGRVILLSFWATWCSSCIEELPSMQKMHQEWKNDGLSVLGINVDESSAEKVVHVLKKYGVDFENFADPEGEVASRFGVYGIPHNMLIDSKGEIVFQAFGPQNWDSPKNRALIQKLLKKRGGRD